jgi:hypothetical protein
MSFAQSFWYSFFVSSNNMPKRFGEAQRSELGRLLDECIIAVTEDPRELDAINREHFPEFMDLQNANSVGNARRRLRGLMAQWETGVAATNRRDRQGT